MSGPRRHRSIIFTGHMIDLPGRSPPRFPESKALAAQNRIRGSLAAAPMHAADETIGIASGARGGDIIFHEEARHLGIRTQIVLPFAPKQFEQTSVAGIATGNWTGRFHTLWHETPEEDRIVLDLPQTDQAYGICNSHILKLAQARGPFHLIALWDGKGGDGPGGAEDLVAKARAAGGVPEIIDPASLPDNGGER